MALCPQCLAGEEVGTCGRTRDRQTDLSFSLLVISSVEALGLVFTSSLSTSCQEKCWGIKRKKKKLFKAGILMYHTEEGQGKHQGNTILDVLLSETALHLIFSENDTIIFLNLKTETSLTVVMFCFAVWYLTANYRDGKARALVKQPISSSKHRNQRAG